MTTSREMTTGPALPLILNFTLPLLLGNLLQQTYSLVDAAIVGQFLGIDALAGVGASSSVIFLILGFCNGCCCGFGIPVAQRFGARDYADMRRYVANALRLAVGISVTVAIVTSIWCADILHAMRTPDNIFHDAYLYLLVTFIGIPCTFFYNLLSNIIRALGDSRTPFWFLLFSTVLNIALDLFCILTLGWGVLGAAVATVVSQGVSAALCFAYMHRHFEILRSTRDERRFRSRHARTLLAIGLPMGLQFSITAIGSIMLQSANNALGSACVAAFTAGVRIKMFVISPFESLGMAMATYTGHNYGAVKPERIWQGIKVAAGLMLGYALFAFVVLMAGSDLLARLFIDPSQSEILADTRLFLHVGELFPAGARPALHPALYDPGRRLHESGDAVGRLGDDRPHGGQPVGRTGPGLHRRLLRRSYGVDRRRPLPRPRLRLRLRTAQTHDAARKTDRRSIIARSSRRAFAAPRGWRRQKITTSRPASCATDLHDPQIFIILRIVRQFEQL